MSQKQPSSHSSGREPNNDLDNGPRIPILNSYKVRAFELLNLCWAAE